MSPDNNFYQQNYLGLLITLNLTSLQPELANEPNYRPGYLLRRGEQQKLLSELKFMLAAQPNDPWLMFGAAWYLLFAGEHTVAVDLILQSYPAFSSEELYSMPMCSPAIEIAWALLQREQSQQANTLLAQCQQQLSDALQSEIRDNYHNHLAARLAALKGDTDLAIQQLQQAMAYGWREWWTFHDPIFATLPPLRQQLDTAISEQRQLVLARAEKDLAPAKPQQTGK